MGNFDIVTTRLKEAALRNTSRIVVVASPPEAEALAQAATPQLLPGLEIAALGQNEPVPEDRLAGTALLVIEVDPNEAASLKRIGAIRQRHPDLPLVAAIRAANVALARTLVREGISDIVSLPFEVEELLQASLDALARREAQATQAGQAQHFAPLAAVARSMGGCGATSIVTHLAAALARGDDSGRGAAVVDLDLQFGSVASYLGIRPRGSIADLLEAEDRLDEELLLSIATEAEDGIWVIAAPEGIVPLESVDTDALLRVVQLLRKRFAYVLLDLPANWTNWALSAALAADAIVLVVELTIASLHQAKRQLELFRSVGIDEQAIQIVANRVEKRLFRTIDLTDVARTLGHEVLGSVTLEPMVSAAQDQGHLVTRLKRKSRFVADLDGLAEQLRTGRLGRPH